MANPKRNSLIKLMHKHFIVILIYIMLKSIFDLPTSKDQLEASNSGFSSWKWLQKAPLRFSFEYI